MGRRRLLLTAIPAGHTLLDSLLRSLLIGLSVRALLGGWLLRGRLLLGLLHTRLLRHRPLRGRGRLETLLLSKSGTRSLECLWIHALLAGRLLRITASVRRLRGNLNLACARRTIHV